MTIHVTQEHIDQGVRQGCYDCPIALALEEATGNQWHVMPKTAREEDCTGGRIRTIRLRVAARRWMLRHDGGALSLPFSFEIPDL